jgi:tetratricopeptide (TPR) repeat protein
MATSTLAAKFTQALAMQQQGQLARAQALYRDILAVAPRHFDALHLLGIVTAQTGDAEAGLRWIGKALAVDPNHAGAYCNQGMALQQLGRMEAALSSFDRAVALKADYAVAYYNRGNVLKELGRQEAALASYDRAVQLRPGFVQAHYNRGVLLQQQQRWEAALSSFDTAVALKDDYAEAYLNRGNVLTELKQLERALASYERALALEPAYADACLNRGLLLQRLGRTEDAIASYDRAIAIDAGFAPAYRSRGVSLQHLKQWQAALASYEQALALDPDYAEAHLSRGDVLQELGQWQTALASYDRALALKPDYADAWCNRGNALQGLHRVEEAIASFDRAIALKPDLAEIHFNKSTALLLSGDLENGWPQYEWRLKCESHSKRELSQPLWLGVENLAGKTILLYAEQGLGDTLQFCRYARVVAKTGARVILAVPDPLANLLSGLEGVAQILRAGEQLPEFDYQCPLLSLPLAFKTSLTTIPSLPRYLESEPAKVAHWRSRLGERSGPRIGLVWRGNPQRSLDQDRSFALADWIGALPGGFQYVSLQKEAPQADREVLRSNPGILNLGPELDDFTDTAALCDCLDAVISVDTSVAHLSAALGRTTWILLSFNAAWRWLLDRDDCPWYPTVRLYRQQTSGVWRDVFERVAADLIAQLKPG